MNKNIALLLANCCKETYNQFHHPFSFIIPDNFQLISDFYATILGKEDVLGFIIESDKYIIIAFRGTQTDHEWMADFDIQQVLFPYIQHNTYVHHGILSIYQSCRDTIFYHLSKIPQEKKILITGHSLGGALSTLCTLDITSNTSLSHISHYHFLSPTVE